MTATSASIRRRTRAGKDGYMWIRHLTLFITNLRSNRALLTLLLVVYYLLIIGGLLILYGKGNFSTPPFVYQGF